MRGSGDQYADPSDDAIPQLLDDSTLVVGWRIQPKYHTVSIKYLTRDGTFGNADEARQAIEDLECAAKDDAIRERSFVTNDGGIGAY